MRTNERKSPCVLQDIVPFGAAAQKQNGVDEEEMKITIAIWLLAGMGRMKGKIERNLPEILLSEGLRIAQPADQRIY